MKIAAIKCLDADGGNTTFSFVKLTLENGLSGWSEYNESFSGAGVTAAIKALSQHMIGWDPRPVEAHVTRLLSMRRVAPGGIAHQAIAAIENALWDVKAKALGIPVYELLGGPVRERIPLYWSHLGFYRALFHEELQLSPLHNLDELKRAAVAAAEAGYRAVKTNLLIFRDGGVHANNPGFARGGSYPERNAERLFQSSLRDQLAAIREGVGNDLDIMLDLNFDYRAEGYVLLSRVAERFNVAWLELDVANPHVLKDIRSRTRTPIASGESLFGRSQYAPFIQSQALDIPVIDVPWNGLSESLKVSTMAETAELNVAPHNFCGPLATMMSVHFCALVPNLRMMEYDPEHVPWYEELLNEPPRIEDGVLALPEGAGWGCEINEEALRNHPP